MKEAIEVQTGKTIDYALTSDVSVGDVVALGGICGVAAVSGLKDEEIALHIEGVYEVAATDADEITVGKEVFFDAAARKVTVTSSGNSRMGVAVSAKPASTAGSVAVKLNVG